MPARWILFLVGALFECALGTHAFAQSQVSLDSSPPSWQEFYIQRYQLPDIYTKLINNTGDGFDSLYGTRNVREVLPGLVYRGGANNAYDKYGKRPNENPLPTMGLDNLCQEGFATAVYLYTTNYSKAPHSVNCNAIRSGAGHLDYLQESATSTSQAHVVLQLTADIIAGRAPGPLYIHCWNGWHASGLMSAMILRQFCGFTASEAVAYWNKNTDGNDVGKSYDHFRSLIENFVPDPALEISAETQAGICPAP